MKDAVHHLHAMLCLYHDNMDAVLHVMNELIMCRVCKARTSAAELNSMMESVEKRLREAKVAVKTICTDEEGL